MTSRLPRPAGLLLAGLLLSACAESDREDATGKATFRGVNAIVGAPDVTFLIEERSLGNATFASSTGAQRFDDLTFTFNFDVSIPGEASQRRLASRDLDATRDFDYIFVLDGTIANPEIRLWEQEEREWTGDEDVFELNVGHLVDGLGAVDVYVDPPGTAPSAGNALATVEPGERAGPFEVSAGNYVVTLTPAGDPQTLLFTSVEREFTAAVTLSLVAFDADPSRTDNPTVRLLSPVGDSLAFAASSGAPELRVLHAALGVDAVDLVEEGDFANPVASNLAFGDLTADTPVVGGSQTYTFTATGNQGATIAEDDATITIASHEYLVLVGPAAEPGIVNLSSARRPFVTSGRVTLFHVASAFEGVDVYLLPAGESVADNSPLVSGLPFQFTTGSQSIAAGDYELTVTVAGEDTVIAGPEPLPVANGDVFEIFFEETADPNAGEFEIVSY